MSEFEIQLTSVPDRENAVVEIWLNDELLCEVNNEGRELEIQFYQKSEQKIDYTKFVKALKEAKSKLALKTD